MRSGHDWAVGLGHVCICVAFAWCYVQVPGNIQLGKEMESNQLRVSILNLVLLDMMWDLT